MDNAKNITGQRFGRLTVICREGTDQNRASTWRCMCDCGNEVVVRGSNLRTGWTQSCGCLQIDKLTTHGKRKSRLWKVWSHMKQRCNTPSCKAYPNYGGRGITVCDDWNEDFQAFYSWAIANGYDGNAPKGQCTIDRIDNDKGYCPENCRWVDMKVQNSNKRKPKRKTRSDADDIART